MKPEDAVTMTIQCSVIDKLLCGRGLKNTSQNPRGSLRSVRSGLAHAQPAGVDEMPAGIAELKMAVEQYSDRRIFRDFDLDRYDVSLTSDLLRLERSDLRPGRFVIGDRATASVLWTEFELHRVRLAARGGALFP